MSFVEQAIFCCTTLKKSVLKKDVNKKGQVPYAQIAGHDSLQGIQTSLGAHQQKWYHLRLKNIKRNTLSDAIKNCPYQIDKGLFSRLLKLPYRRRKSIVKESRIEVTLRIIHLQKEKNLTGYYLEALNVISIA